MPPTLPQYAQSKPKSTQPLDLYRVSPPTRAPSLHHHRCPSSIREAKYGETQNTRSSHAAPQPLTISLHGCFTIQAVFKDTHVTFGLAPCWGLSQRLQRIVGASRAQMLSYTSRKLTAKVHERLHPSGMHPTPHCAAPRCDAFSPMRSLL